MSDAGIDFGALYEEFAPILTRQLGRSVGNREDVADLVQETFARAVRAGDRFDHDRPAGPWLSTIARRLSIDAARARSVRSDGLRLALVAEISTSVDSPEQGCLDREQARAVVQAVAALPHRQQRILLRRSLGYSYEELADEEDLTVSAVKSLLNRARVAARRNYETETAERRVPIWVVLARRLRTIAKRGQHRVARRVHAAVANTSWAAMSSSAAGLMVVAVAGTVGLSPAHAGGQRTLPRATLASAAFPPDPTPAVNAATPGVALAFTAHRLQLEVSAPTAAPAALRDTDMSIDVGHDNDTVWRKAIGHSGPITYDGRDQIGLRCDHDVAAAMACEVIDAAPQS